MQIWGRGIQKKKRKTGLKILLNGKDQELSCDQFSIQILIRHETNP